MAEQRGSPFVVDLMNRKRRRVTSIIFKVFEDAPWYRALPRAERDRVRNEILGAISVYHEDVLDVLRSSVSDGTTNVAALRLLEEIHERVTREREQHQLSDAGTA